MLIFVVLDFSSGRQFDLLDLPNPPHGNSILSSDDLCRMFMEDEHDSTCGRFILGDSLCRAISFLQVSAKRSRRVLVGQSLLFLPGQFLQDWNPVPARASQPANVVKKLQRLLRNNGHHALVTSATEALVDEIWRVCDRILLPYHVNYNHFIVLDIVLRSTHGPYIKVWDGMKLWQKERSPQKILEIQSLSNVFFKGRDVPVELWRPGDPTQETGYGCGAFAFLVMSHLAQDQLPPPWTCNDEAVARSYLWGCIRNGEVLPLPQYRLQPRSLLAV
jgi:hypothetical protein